jgi:hypothetical protein
LGAPERRDISAALDPVNARNRLRLLSLTERRKHSPMDPLTPLDTLCRIILRAREYEAQTPTDYDGGEAADNVDDEDEGTLSVLDDTINDSVEEELKVSFEDLGEDQLAEVLALSWIGAGTYEAADWDEAFSEAQDIVSSGTDGAVDELMDMPMLASVLESGMAAFDLSCDGIGDLS